MGSLKEDWKETGKDLGGAFKQLGKSIVKSGATVVNKANDWAERDDAKEAAKKEAEVAPSAEPRSLTRRLLSASSAVKNLKNNLSCNTNQTKAAFTAAFLFQVRFPLAMFSLIMPSVIS